MITTYDILCRTHGDGMATEALYDIANMIDDNYLAGGLKFGKVAIEVGKERNRQIAKFGEQNHEDLLWLAIITEELGEYAQAIIHQRRSIGSKDDVRKELIHVAASAIAALEAMDRR